MPGYTGWSRSVRVEWVSATSPSTLSLLETVAKCMTGIVKFNNIEVARQVAIRTKSAPPKS